MSTTSALVKALESAWAEIQTHHSSTPNSIIVVAPVSKNGTYTKFGHYAEGRWTVTADVPAEAEALHAWATLLHTAGRRQASYALLSDVFDLLDAVDSLHAPEILISAEGLDRGARQVFRTLLHEGVHGIAARRGEKDTSRGGRYHNKVFARIATEVGLTLEKDPRIGFMTPDLTDETALRYREAIDRIEVALKITRSVEGGVERAKSKGSGTNGVVLVCGCNPQRKMRMAEGVLDLGPVICGICEEEFRPEGDRPGPVPTNGSFVQFLKGEIAR